MTVVLIVVLAILLLAACFTLLVMAVLLVGGRRDSQTEELARLVHQTRQADEELHTLTTNALRAMLEELRWQK
jgi:hypothetical protein